MLWTDEQAPNDFNVKVDVNISSVEIVAVTEKEQAYDNPDDLEINLNNITQIHKPIIDYAGMINVGADIEEFPELKQLPADLDD